VRAVIDGFHIPPRDLERRAALEHAVSDPAGLAAAYARLAECDPRAARRIDPGNARRIVRALEVLEATGLPFSTFGPGLDDYPPPFVDVTQVGVWLPRVEQARRIGARFASMRDRGLEAEVRRLAVTPGGLSRTARQAIGYKEVLASLDGEIPCVDDAFDLAVRRTRKFARRQRVWFRRDPRIRWVGAARNPGDLRAVVLALWEPADAMLASQRV
jgi:tRNA dimethylallyltransferase